MTFCNITRKECKNKANCKNCEISKKYENYRDYEKTMDEAETKTMRELATELQTHCHEGETNRKVMIKVLDTYYKISGIKKVISGDETYFVIETEV